MNKPVPAVSTTDSSITTTTNNNIISSQLPIYPAYCHPAAPTFKKWVKLTGRDIHALRDCDSSFSAQNIYFHLNHPVEYVYIIGPVVAVDHLVTRYNTRFSLIEIDDGSGATVEVKITYRAPKSAPRPPVTAPSAVQSKTLQPVDHDTNDSGTSSGDDDDEEDDEDEDPLAPPKTNTTKKTAQTLFEPTAEDARAIALLTPRITETTVNRLVVSSGPAGTSLLLDNHPIDVGTVLKAKGTLNHFRGSMQMQLRRAFIVSSVAEELAAWKEYTDFAERVLSTPWVLSDAEVEALREKERARVEADAKRAEKLKAREARKLARRKELEEKMERYERRVEEKLAKETPELDGNALDRPGWKPYVPADKSTLAREKNRENGWAKRTTIRRADTLQPRDRTNIDACVPLRHSEKREQLVRGDRHAPMDNTTAKAVLEHEKLNRADVLGPYSRGPARWQHEYTAEIAEHGRQPNAPKE